MSEGLKIALTALAGIRVFVMGQIVQRWPIDPIQEQRRLVGKIIHAVTYYGNVHIETRTPEQIKEAVQALRNLSSQVLENVSLIGGWMPARDK